ncbi:MAG: IS200/IS605 family transposase [Janthinobacterium lividum]
MLKNKLCVAVHFVWATWDRQPLITEEIERDLWRYIEVACADDHCEVLAVGGMLDHVHLLALLSNTVTLADLMKHIKGGSSLFVSDELRPAAWFKWQGSYGAFSVSGPDIDKIVHYIQNQRQHHTDGTLWSDAEEPGRLSYP